MSATGIYQIKVTLKWSKPPIWRRIQVRGNTKLGELHDILQIVMGWTDSHLHAFTANGVAYGMPDHDFAGLMRDEHKVRLDQIAKEGKTVRYEYDFGDGWLHELKVEKILPAESGVHYPRCLGGKRAGPSEDCGGVPGYEHLLSVLAGPDDEERRETLAWIGGEFDPEAFDLVETNEILGEMR